MSESLLDFKNTYPIVISLLFIILFIISYLRRKKFIQSATKIIYDYKDICNIVEDNIIIISKKNEILYANTSAISFLSLKRKYFKTKFNMIDVNVNDEKITLENFMIKNKNKSKNNLKVYSNTDIFLKDHDDSTEVNLYFIDSYVKAGSKVPCTIVIIDSSRNEKSLLAFKHKLTGLPSQVIAINTLNSLYAKLHLGENKIAVIIMNIDDFSTLRSIVGYDQSNQILLKFANYLSKQSKKSNFSVYHTDQNNFLLIMPNISGEKDILSVVETIQKELISFYTIDGSGLHLTASTEASIFPDSSSKLNLVDNAYKALSIAEKNGFARVEIFTKNQTNHSYDELKLYNDMHKALERKELEVYYQPIVNAKTRNIVAAEALVRWMHPEHGLISPFVFIPIMEKTGLIVELGKYMLDGVLSQQRRWKEFGLRQVEVSINLSMLEFETGKFVSHVDTKLKEYQVSPRLIKFEVTEGIAMINEKKTSKQLNDLRDMGIGISLDDFGTGYTSFSYLKKIPANTLKIDRSLILNIVKNEDDQQIVQGIIDLGHTLNMKIVVEGIETKDMYEKIRDMGGDFIQGYYFSKPVPVYEFQKLLN